MSPLYPDGEEFTQAVTPYAHEPLTGSDVTVRIMVEVEILGFRTRAMVDTGGVYLLCSPGLACVIDFSDEDKLGDERLTLPRFGTLDAHLYRIPLAILPEEGTVPYLEVTACVPCDPEQYDDEEPYVILGYHCCLERTPIAVDPSKGLFHFGSPEEPLD